MKTTSVDSKLITAGVTLGLMAVALSPLPAADTWWHLAAGDLILRTGSLPATDVFSFTAGQHPWTNHEWLVEILFAGIYKLGGLAALFGLKVLLIGLAFGLIPAIVHFRSGGQGYWLWVLPALAFACELDFYVDARAYLFTYLFLALTVLAMTEYQQGGNRAWLALCVVMQIPWVNCHGGFILGPAVMGVFFLVGPNRKELFWACTLTILASCLNPYGYEMLLFPFSLLQVDHFSVGLNEWAQPELLTKQLPYLISTIFYLSLPFVSRKPLNWGLFLSSLAFVLLGLKAWRHEPLAGLMMSFVLPHLLPELDLKPKTLRSYAILLPLLALALLWSRPVKSPRQLALLPWFPESTVEFIKRNPELPKHTFHPYGWGGFLLWQLGPDQKVFFDGRAHTVYPAEVYSDGYYLEYGEAWLRVLDQKRLSKPNCGRLELLNKYQVDLVLCNKRQGDLHTVLLKSGAWLKILEDQDEVLYLRDTPEYRNLSTRLKR